MVALLRMPLWAAASLPFSSKTSGHWKFLRPQEWRPRRSTEWTPQQCQRLPGFCNAALKSKDGPVLDQEIARVLEQANRALERWEVCHTDFLTPPVLHDSLESLKKLSEAGAMVSGGYPEAERCRLSVGPAEVVRNAQCSAGGYPGAVSAVSVYGNFIYDSAAHADFLGAILGTGIVREKVGDILVLDNRGAHVLIVPDLLDFLVNSLKQVKTTPVQCKEISLTELEIRQPSTKPLKSVEASLRLDAVASAGFKISRSKLAELISKGDVRVNWKEVTKSNTTLKTGDVISLAGKGRLEIGEIETTKKGKYAIEMIRYV